MSSVLAMRCLPLIFAALLLTACRRDRPDFLHAAAQPRAEEVVGAYVLVGVRSPYEVNFAEPGVIDLRADGTFTAKNVSAWREVWPGMNYKPSLVSGAGRWEVSAVDSVGFSSRKIWGVSLRTPDGRVHSATFIGRQPPYDLTLPLGDPDDGDVLILGRTL